jgi:hypothetical protein
MVAAAAAVAMSEGNKFGRKPEKSLSSKSKFGSLFRKSKYIPNEMSFNTMGYSKGGLVHKTRALQKHTTG